MLPLRSAVVRPQSQFKHASRCPVQAGSQRLVRAAATTQSTRDAGAVRQSGGSSAAAAPQTPPRAPVAGKAEYDEEVELLKARVGWVRDDYIQQCYAEELGAERIDTLSAEMGSVDDWVAAVRALQARLDGAVRAEEDHTLAATKLLYRTSNEARLRSEGIMLTGLEARRDSTLYGDVVYALLPANKEALPYNKFHSGDPVLLTFMKDLTGKKPSIDTLDATILETSKYAFKVAVTQDTADALDTRLDGSRLRMDRSLRVVSARRMLTAIDALSACDWKTLTAARVHHVISGLPLAAQMAKKPSQWASNASFRADARRELSRLRDQGRLNMSQAHAISTALTSTVTLWQGPPGSGKTRTLVALLRVMVHTAMRLRTRWDSMGAILACADTNAAVDNLVEGCHAEGLRVVRIGQAAVVRPSLRHLTLYAQASASPEAAQAQALRDEAEKLMEAYARARQMRAATLDPNGPPLTRDNETAAETQCRAKAWRLRREAEELMEVATNRVMANVQVIAATCIGSVSSVLGGRKFRVVVIDEATQATEASTLVPLTQGAECVVVAGDPRQLPPTVLTMAAKKEMQFDRTLFERLQEDHGLQPLLLNTQYRMHPGLADFASRSFYGGQLRSGITEAERPMPAGLPWPRPLMLREVEGGATLWTSMPVVLVNADSGEERAVSTRGAERPPADGFQQAGVATVLPAGSTEWRSFVNDLEADLAMQAVHALLEGGDVTSVAMLTPYRGQVRAIEALMRLHARHFAKHSHVEVHVSTVDGYQGREADAVVFCAVRNNEKGSLGFVTDPRRLNVAITRPRHGLVVIGSPRMLRRSLIWSRWLDWCRNYAGQVQPSWLPKAPWMTARGGGD